MTTLIDEQLQHNTPGQTGWSPTPQPTDQFQNFVPTQPSPLSSAFQYPPAGYGQPGPIGPAGYPPPPAPAPSPVATSAPGFSAKLTPASMLMIVLLAVGGWYYYQHHHKPTPAPSPSASQPAGSTGTGTSGGTSGGSGTSGSTGTSGGTGTSGSTSSGSGQAALSPADTKLLTHVPSDIQSSCSGYQLDGADAAVECKTSDESGDVIVVYAQYSAATLGTAFSAETQGLDYVPVGACSSGQCTYGGDGSSNSGKVDYFTDQGQDGPVVGAVWSNTRTSILAIASQGGTDIGSLVTWWGSSAGPN